MTFKKGESGNVLGRPPGSRRGLREDFLRDMHEDWQANGAAAIRRFRSKRPGDYVKVIASLLPKEFNVKVSEMAQLTDEQLDRQYADICAEIERIERSRRHVTVLDPMVDAAPVPAPVPLSPFDEDENEDDEVDDVPTTH